MIPGISIVIPFHHETDLLEESVDSVRNGTFGDWEMLLVNDHSYEQSCSLAQRFAQTDARIRVISSQEQGIVAALNLGVGEARADIIARMDADDQCYPQRLELQYRELMSNPKVALTSCLVEPLSDTPVNEGMRRYLTWVNNCRTSHELRQGLLQESPLPHPSVMFRKARVMELGGYRQYRGPEDYDLWLRMKEKGCIFSKVARPLLRWRIHSASLSRRDGRYSLRAFENRKFEHVFWVLQHGPARDRGIIVWGAGRFGGRLGKWLMGRGITVAGFMDIDPAKQGSIRHGVPIMAPEAIPRGPDHRFYLCYVTRWDSRKEIREDLTARGKMENEDFLIL